MNKVSKSSEYGYVLISELTSRAFVSFFSFSWKNKNKKNKKPERKAVKALVLTRKKNRFLDIWKNKCDYD